MNNKQIILGVIVVLIIGVVIFTAVSDRPHNLNDGSQGGELSEAEQNNNIDNDKEIKFANDKKSAHYESNTPAHGSILAAPPINIVINFNFDLAAPSSISVTKDNKEYGLGETIIDTNKLSMRRNFSADAPDGIYKVTYNACWPDKSCHDGNFEFAIDRGRASTYENMKNRKEVTIRMSEIMFKPKNIVISPGTKITWINDEYEEHYINTDSHPAHTYYPEQNSRSLARGATYSVTFNKVGSYPYHCSAHASKMIGNIVVS